MSSDILIDGYNMIKNNPIFRSLEIKSLMEARNLLIRQLKNRYRHTTHRVIVVFDGNGVKEQVSYDDHIKIIFSRLGETADRVIMRLAAEAQMEGQKVEMYSNDEEIRHIVAQQGSSTYTTGQLTQQLNAPPRDIATRSYHRQAMRREYGIDPSCKPDDELECSFSPYKKKHRKQRKFPHRYR